MRFKEESMREQFESRPALLKEICAEFCALSESFGVEPVVTRVTDPVPGESGVHPAGRAVDFRDEYSGLRGVFRLYTDAQAEEIVRTINAKYPRKDGKLVCIHHCFNGGRLHFHLQIGRTLSVHGRNEI